jgi:hypothetical protein
MILCGLASQAETALVGIGDLRPDGRNLLVRSGIECDYGFGGIVEQRIETRVEVRQPVLDAGFALRRVGLSGDDVFGDREDDDVVELGGRKLGRGTVGPNSRHPSVRMFDADRIVGPGREHVDDLSADRDLAGLVHTLVESVADTLQSAAEFIRRDCVAGADDDARIGPRLARRQPLHDRCRCGDQDFRPHPLRKCGEHRDAPAHDLA